MCKFQEKHGLSREETLKSIFQEDKNNGRRNQKRSQGEEVFQRQSLYSKIFYKGEEGRYRSCGGIVIGAIGHAIIDNAVNGGKTVAWYDYWDKEGHEDSMTYTKTPSIREIKRGGINGKISMIAYDKKEFESVAEKENWDIRLRNEEE